MSFILPKIEEILNLIQIENSTHIIAVKDLSKVNDSNSMEIDQPVGSFPNISFSQNINLSNFNNNNIPSSLFSESGGHIVKSNFNQASESIIYKTKIDKNKIKADKECFYVFYALKVINLNNFKDSLTVLLNYISTTENANDNKELSKVFYSIIERFGENILPNLIKDEFSFNSSLNLII